MDFGHPAVISREKPDQHVREVEAGVTIEPPHDAEIDDSDCAIGIDEHVPGMKIGVKEAVSEDLVEEGCSGFTQQIFDGMPSSEERRLVVDADPGYPLEGQ